MFGQAPRLQEVGQFTWFPLAAAVGHFVPPFRAVQRPLPFAPADWTLCASEGGVCAFTGTREVRYGANGAFFFKTLTDGTASTNEVFGDPIVNSVKECSIQ